MKEWYWNLLFGHRALDRVIPHFEEFLAHPAERLAHRPIRIGPHRTFRMAIFYLLGMPILPFAMHLDGPLGLQGTLDVALFTLVTLGPLTALAAILQNRWHALILDRDGVQFKHGASVVVCPWDLFNVPGNAFLMERDWGTSRVLVLPVAADVVARVELRRHGVCVAAGKDIKTRQLRFNTPNEAVLSIPYETPWRELGNLLLQLGRILGGQTADAAASAVSPSSEVPLLAEDLSGEDLPEATVSTDGYGWLTEAAVSADGWLTVYLTRLPFPPICCDCGRATRQRLPVEVGRSDAVGIVKTFLGYEEVVSVPIPVCAVCQRSYRRKWWRGYFLGLTGCLLVVAALVLQAVFGEHIRLLPMVMFFVLLLVPFLPYWIGSLCGGKPPVEVGSYWPRERAVTLRFTRPGYTDQTLADAARLQ